MRETTDGTYAQERVGDSIAAADIVYDIFDHASPEKHDEFLLWAGQALGVTFDHPKEGEDTSNGYYQIRPATSTAPQKNRQLELILTIAQDWLETVDPSYAEELLGLNPQSEELQQALQSLRSK